MESWMWIVIAVAGVVVLLCLVALALRARRRRRAQAHSAELRQRFGGEYQRAVSDRDREAGEQALEARAERFEAMATTDLPQGDRQVLHQGWERIQATFVEDPPMAVSRANRLVMEAMERRGLPAERVDDRAMAAALIEPDLADRYRHAHATYIAIEAGDGNVPDESACRRAFLDYRAVFGALVDQPQQAASEHVTVAT